MSNLSAEHGAAPDRGHEANQTEMCRPVSAAPGELSRSAGEERCSSNEPVWGIFRCPVLGARFGRRCRGGWTTRPYRVCCWCGC